MKEQLINYLEELLKQTKCYVEEMQEIQKQIDYLNEDFDRACKKAKINDKIIELVTIELNKQL